MRVSEQFASSELAGKDIISVEIMSLRFWRNHDSKLNGPCLFGASMI